MSGKWTSSGPTVYDEHGEWIADCRVPSVYSQSKTEAIAKCIADDHNEVERMKTSAVPTDFTVRPCERTHGIEIALADDPDELLVIADPAEARRVAAALIRVANKMEASRGA